jgi:uncharacterized membrane protein
MKFFSLFVSIVYCSLALYAIIFRIKSIRKSIATYKANGDKTILYSEALWSLLTMAIVVFFIYQSKLLNFFSQ